MQWTATLSWREESELWQCNKERLCIHIEATHLVDGTYELMPAHENESQYARVNLTELIQGPDQSLEELKASNAQ